MLQSGALGQGAVVLERVELLGVQVLVAPPVSQEGQPGVPPVVLEEVVVAAAVVVEELRLKVQDLKR